MNHCPACQSTSLVPMFDMGHQPMSLVELQEDPEQSNSLRRYRIKLAICLNCSHVHNTAFNPDYAYYTGVGCRMYNSGSKWQDHLDRVRTMLVDVLKDSHLVVEIGAGDCEFLATLDTPGVKLAVDPCEAVERAEELGIPYSRKTFDYDQHVPSDSGLTLLLARHLLEHLDDPRSLLEEIATKAKKRSDTTYLYLEVPCCEVALKNRRIEDWTYEHVQHFTLNSMRALLRNSGIDHFVVTKQYDNEVLSVVAKIVPAPVHPADLNVDEVIGGYAKAHKMVNDEGVWMRNNLGQLAFWGGAGKSAMFINLFCLPQTCFVVDSHDEKWGMCVPGRMTKILNPETLRECPTHYIVATTSWRAEDIRDEIKRHNIPCKGLLKFQHGKLMEVPLG